MISFIKKVLSDVDGNPSAKRTFTGLLIIAAIIIAVGYAFIPWVRMETLAAICSLAGIGFTAIAAERFGKQFGSNDANPNGN